MQVWDRADGDALARERGNLAVVREIGQALIAFLAAIEDVQAALFEKRKFVLRNDCLVRVSALDANHKSVQTLIDQARSNGAQVGEWVEWLGEKPLSRSASAKAIEKRGAELLAAYPHVCLHTKHFDESYKYGLLAQFEDLEAATGGVLTHAENYAALGTLEYVYRQRIKCGTGIDLFTGVGFYPDFLMWLKRDSKQMLCFVEPKGLGRAWPLPKIDLLAKIEQQSPPGLPLRGFTVTPTPLAEIQSLCAEVTQESLAVDHILLQGQTDDYIARILLSLRSAL